MGPVMAKLGDTAAHVIAMSILVRNLRKIRCILGELLDGLLGFPAPVKKWTVIPLGYIILVLRFLSCFSSI